jgi:hypothetical protein
MSAGLVTFLWGFGGSIAVEIVSMLQAYEADHRALPPRYREFGYWVCRILVAAIGGGLAIAHGISGNPLLAINIGAATPLIIQAFARGIQPSAAQLPSSTPEKSG